MKRTLTLLGLPLMLLAMVAFAQRQMDDANERAVQITQGPNVTNITGESATINWTTNSNGANQVRYRVAGSNQPWQSAYHQGGGTNHSLQLTGLEPGRTYEWQILTRDGDMRTGGQFQTANHRHGHAADVNGGSYPASGGEGDRGRGDGDRGYGRGDRGHDAGDRGYGVKVPLYRAVNTENGGHLYSTNARDQHSHNFKAEGIAGSILSTQSGGAVPLYCMTSPNGDFLLTTEAAEIARMQVHGYQDGGIIGYVESSQVAGTQPLYRLVKPDGSGHFFTTSASEHAQVLRSGWRDEGVAGYIWP
jgi:Repeat of unknown function (DUF5648)/Purple acid Phosphatase, N-terminal domain